MSGKNRMADGLVQDLLLGSHNDDLKTHGAGSVRARREVGKARG
jgi:hypothetical protein